MKQNLLLLFLCFSLFSVTLPSCSDADASDTTEYYCPMKCEGDKTYTSEDSCPVCGMDLKEKNN